MKKKLLILGIIGLVPLLTACACSKDGNESKMTCKYNTSYGTITYTLTFDSDEKLKGASVEEFVDFSKAACGDNCQSMQQKALEKCQNDSDYSVCSLKNETSTSVIIAATHSDSYLSSNEGLKKGQTKKEASNILAVDGYKCS